ncbi:MAG: PRC-barrel domain-containing protein [Promethearchaeota archaeon]
MKLEPDQLRLSLLSRNTVVDKNGKRLGRIKDAVVDMSTFQIRGYVIIEGRIREKLEDLKVVKDVDPFVSLAMIDKLREKTITLNTSAEELQNVMEPGFLAENELLFSKISEMPVLDNRGNKLGIFTDIIQKDDLCEFVIGGKEFLRFLRERSWTENLTYIIQPVQFDFAEGQFKIKEDIKQLERSMKLHMTNVIRELLLVAFKDGILTDDERDLIEAIQVDLDTYEEALAQAKYDNVITLAEERHLEQLKERILRNTRYLALKDETITDEERELMEKLASFMVDRRKELFWSIFGSSDKKFD